ncbi:hypothetical protein GEMRC1_004535 [Eukaryota sp. GEM-RC1]
MFFPTSPKIRCVAVVSKSDTPLFISLPPSDENIVFHFMVHSALDYIDEKLKPSRPSRSSCYLDLLFPYQLFRVYGYVTPTDTKFILIIDDSNVTKTSVLEFFKSIHSAFMKVALNPFFEDGSSISSTLFLNRVTTASNLLEGELKTTFKG